MDLNDFIDKNRATIDEFLGPNREEYAQISLKGYVIKEIGKSEAFRYFEHWNRMGMTTIKQNVEMRKILDVCRYNEKDVKDITPEDKILYLKIMKEEFIC